MYILSVLYVYFTFYIGFSGAGYIVVSTSHDLSLSVSHYLTSILERNIEPTSNVQIL